MYRNNHDSYLNVCENPETGGEREGTSCPSESVLLQFDNWMCPVLTLVYNTHSCYLNVPLMDQVKVMKTPPRYWHYTDTKATKISCRMGYGYGHLCTTLRYENIPYTQVMKTYPTLKLWKHTLHSSYEILPSILTLIYNTTVMKIAPRHWYSITTLKCE